MCRTYGFRIVLLFALLPASVCAAGDVAGRVAIVEGKRPWGPEQATGAPDTPGAGDIQTAWASRSADGQDEWLELEYAEAVEPAAVVIHETYNPGAVYKVTAYTKTGMEALLWEGRDPTDRTAARGVSTVVAGVKLKTKRIRIYLKSKEVPGWNEIDAVGLKDAKGNIQWAKKAKASSTYAELGGGPIVLPDPFLRVDPRDRRIEKLEEEVRELKMAVEELKKALQEKR